jgi:copper homeostasis protein
VILEVCVDSLPGALAAVEGGADRLELCAALEVGGVTPSRGLLEEVRARVELPVVVLVRPRAGDFVYGAVELSAMLRDVESAREAGAAGVATGALRAGGSIDRGAVEELVAASRPLPVCFHRAFDLCAAVDRALEVLVELDVERVLTSGAAPSAPEGAATLARLVTSAAGRLSVMAGGGVRAENAAELVARSGVREVHASCAGLRPGAMRTVRTGVALGAGGDAGAAYRAADPERVRALRRALEEGC